MLTALACLVYLHVAAGDGIVYFYNFGKDRQQPVKVLDVCGSVVPVYALGFNRNAPELFATADLQAVKVCCMYACTTY